MEQKPTETLHPINELCKIQPTIVSINRTDIYLNQHIGKPHHYFEMLEILRSGKEEDEIFIHLNNSGGSLDTTIQIINAMKESEAKITTCLDGSAHSAASIILLSGDAIKVSKYGTMLCHYYTDIVVGKGHEIDSVTQFDKKYYKKFFKEIYKKFLTPSELTKLIEGKDYWFSSEDIMKRLNKNAGQKKNKTDN